MPTGIPYNEVTQRKVWDPATRTRGWRLVHIPCGQLFYGSGEDHFCPHRPRISPSEAARAQVMDGLHRNSRLCHGVFHPELGTECVREHNGRRHRDEQGNEWATPW